MADEKKGVSVQTPRGSGWDDVEFGNGYDVRVNDGHLFVYDSDSSTIAVFAPSKWWNVKVVR